MDKEADITLSYTVQRRTMPEPYSVYGDVGTNIAPGSKEILWKVLEDFESFEYVDVVRLTMHLAYPFFVGLGLGFGM